MNAVLSRHRHLDEIAPWNDRLQVLEVIGVTDEAPGVKTFAFRAEADGWFRYRPGQFVTLELPTPDGPLLRTYTLSSSPSRPFAIAVTVKAQADSLGTRWMFEHLAPGMRLRAHGPAGQFSHLDHPAQKYLFVSAGSGVTPMMSMLRWMEDCAPGTDVAFVHCARRPDDIIFRRELELLSARMPHLSLGFVVEEKQPGAAWPGLRGRIDQVKLSLLCSDFAEREVFCCGPDPFMRAVRDMLKDLGADPARFHQESFGAPPLEIVPPPFADASPPADRHEAAAPVRFVLSNAEAMAEPGQTLLQAARACGVRIPAACEFGLCGTCKVKKVAGAVEMSHNGGILDREIDEGFVLACCSRPLGPVEIEA